MAKWASPVVWPARFVTYDPAAWVDRLHWAGERWAFWQAHPEVQRVVDPVELLAERVRARRAAGRESSAG